MKNKFVLVLIVFLGITGCKQGEGIEAKKQELAKLEDEREQLDFKIDQLRNQIENLDPEALELEKRGKLVTVFELEDTLFRNFIDIQGTAKADLNVPVSAETGGDVLDVAVDEGDVVKAGQLLVRLDDELLQRELADLQISLDLATTMFERQKSLWEKNIGSEIQFLEAKNKVESLQAKLNKLQTQLSKTRVKAPISGTVENVRIKTGEVAKPGMTLMNVVNLDKITIEADVPERYVGSIKTGDSVTVSFPALGMERRAAVGSVGNVINPANRAFRVEIRLPNNDQAMKANLLSVIKIIDYEKKDALVLPTRIVQHDRGESYVYKVDTVAGDALAKKVIVKTGKSYSGQTEITSGLSEGDVIIDAGSHDVTEGSLLDIQNQSED